MFTQFLAIARNAFTESIRQPVYTVVLLAVLGLLVLNLPLSTYTFDDDNKLMIDLGLSTMLVGGLLLAAFTAAGVVTREIESGTVLTIVSKPVARPVFIAGKYAGVAAAMTLALFNWGLLFLLTIRHGVLQTAAQRVDQPVIVFGCIAGGMALGVAILGNYLLGRHFGSMFACGLSVALAMAYVLVLFIGKGWKIQPLPTDFNGQVVAALLLLLEAVLLLCAVAVAASVRLGQVATLLLCAAVLLLGLSNDYAFGRFAETSATARLCYRIVPNFQFLWLSDALTQEHPVTGRYILLATAYAALCIAAAMGVAIALFQRRQAA